MTRTLLLPTLMLTTASALLAHGHDHREVHFQFHENRGQWPAQVLYRALTPAGAVFVERSAFTYLLTSGGERATHGRPGAVAEPFRAHAFRVHFEGGRAGANEGAHRMGHYVNYFLGNDPSAWATGVPVFAGVELREVYPGIGMRIDGHDGLKYDWLVAPGADPSRITMRYEGQDALRVEHGLLFVETSAGRVVEQRPVAWQEVHGTRRPVECRYTLKGDRVGFELPYGHDPRYPLTIDPTVVFSSYSGSTGNNFGLTATYDDAGHLYGGGTVFAAGYPVTPGVIQGTFAGPGGLLTMGTDMGISKFAPNGTSLIWSTYLGGTANEAPHSMVANGAGELFIMGTTGSTDFPTTTGCYQNAFRGGSTPPFGTGTYGFAYTTGSDIVVAHLNTTATALIGSTYLGGTGNDGLNQTTPVLRNYGDPFRGEIILDQAGNPMVATSTVSNNMPVTPGAPQATIGGGQDAYLFRMDPALTTLLWGTYHGGSGTDAGFGMQVSSNGEIYVTGGTTSNNLPMAGTPFRSTFGGNTDGYIARYDPTGGQLLSSTYLGTSAFDQSYFVQLDLADNVYVIGTTLGAYPVSAGRYANPNASQFIHKLNGGLSASVWSTRIGGNGNENLSPTAFLVSNCGQIYFSAWGGSTNLVASNTNGLPVTPGAFQTTTDGSDFYLMVLNQDAASLSYATYFGGTSAEHVDGGTSRFDKNGIVYQAVCAGCSGTYPTTPGVVSTANRSNCNLGVLKMDFEQGVQVNLDVDGGVVMRCLGAPFVFTARGTATTWIWDFGDGSPRVQGNPVPYVYPQPGTYRVMLIGIDSTSCNLADTVYVDVNVVPRPQMVALFDADPSGNCQGFSVRLTNNSTGGNVFFWRFGDGGTSTDRDPVHPYSGPGSYIITLAVIDPLCRDTVFTSDTITFDPPSIDYDLPSPVPICDGGSVTLDAGPGYNTYTWSTGATTRTITVNQPGDYRVRVTDGICVGIDTIRVISRSPYPPLPDLVVCPGGSASISANFPVRTILWNTGATTPTITAGQEGLYWFTGADSVGCTVRDTVAVTIISREDADALVPNVFSPNRDGKNDTFRVRGRSLDRFSMEIYNRWGQKMYETSSPDRGWNGGLDNNASNAAPEGTYYYIISFKSLCSRDELDTHVGHVTLLR